MPAFFKNDGFQFAVENALGEGYHRATDVGEVLATISRIPNGDVAARVREWSATGDRLAGVAGAAEATGTFPEVSRSRSWNEVESGDVRVCSSTARRGGTR